MLISYKRGATGIILRVKILDSSVSTGAGKTGLAYNTSGLIISTIADNESAATAYTVAGSTIEDITTLGTYAAPTSTKCRFKEVDSTNHKGIYEVQIADARYAVSSAKSLLISISGATGAAECDVCIPLTDLDPYGSSNAHTFASLTITGALTISDGVVITCSTSNKSAVSATGNGTGHGLAISSGSGATGNGVNIVSAATNGNGINAAGVGTGSGVKSTGGATGHGINALGGATSGDGINAAASTLGDGIDCAGAGSGGVGFKAAGGTNAAGVSITGAGSGAGILVAAGSTGIGVSITTTAGDGLSITPTAGNAIVATANGTSKHGFVITGGTGGTSDGLKAVAGTGGVAIRGSITGDITGSLSGATNINASGTAQAGASGSITLASGASATNDWYNGCEISIETGTGAIQTRIVTDYNGTSKVATVDRAWVTTPDNTSTYTIRKTASAKLTDALAVTTGDGEVMQAGVVDDVSPTASQFKGDSSLSSADDYYNGCWLAFVDGTTNGGQWRKVSDYVGATRTFKFLSAGSQDTPFPAAPSDTDGFRVGGLA